MNEQIRATVAHEKTALIVDDVVKGFHQPTTPVWKRLIGRGNPPVPSEKSPGKRPVIAVDHVSFEVPRGEIFGVLGPNGSGKSTLIRVISTLLLADSGHVSVFGLDTVRHEMDVKRMINRVSVDAAFFKKLSPMENLLYGARLYGVSGSDAQRMATDILKRLGLKESTFVEPMEEMSRGQQQKVAIARAFLTSPILLLLDEPTTGLDPRSKREVRAFVEELRDVHDATIVITTHDMEEAEALCDRVAIIHDGKVVALDTPDALKAQLPRAELVTAGADVRYAPPPTLEDVFMSLTGEILVNRDELELEPEL